MYKREMADMIVPATGLGRLTVILSLLMVTSALYDGRQLCANCDEVETATECTNYMWCASDEKCMTSRYLTVDGHARFYTGCTAKRACDSLEHHGIALPLDSLFPVPRRVLDQSCCNGQGCNGLRSASKGRSLCMTCKDILNPSDCDSAVLCGEHQECLYHEHLQFNDLYQAVYKYELKCEDRNLCPVQNGTSSCHHSKRSPGCSGDYGCCTADFCNLFHAMYNKNLTSSTIVAGSVQLQTRGTPPPSTTSSPQSTKCYTGAGTGRVQLCTGSTAYCLTNLTNYNSGYREVFKGCVSEQDCYRLPRSTTSLSGHCDLFNEDILYERDFSCSYCCDKDLCNGRIVPPPETVYVPNTTAAPIITRNEPNDVTIHDCRDAMSVEQCQVFPCDNEHLARMYCRRHCLLCK
ncbi:uncharacterized protein LOC110451094 [Mizuhopecten yessoensis]|uniref:Uncharacterized protein n=1 Tax=Mizuhopecten yessoensis TaxID=6573 RepID=A0A210QMH2_MIZYE|nr:uncharacterized protein LOC110451094 [Mizuhopecten yessoensis]OWF49928.1 hypothetical protein KP79_PYT04018 [Mizuhopecten yessoensis]